jgi:Fe-S cluster assembly scaffold protein SufB
MTGEGMKKIVKITKNTKINKTFLLKGSEEYDLNIELVHSAPKIRSEVLVKGVLYDSSRVRITVNLKIDKKAIETETYFRCEILNLGDNSSAQVFPYLEISQNQLKAGHAVSIRRVREDEMFFLQSRGLSENQAKELIVEGFLK